MAVFHFTFHAYRSWNADHPRGYVHRGEKGILLPDETMARARDSMANFSAVRFDEEETRFLVAESHDVTRRREVVLYGVTAMETHLHIVVGWKEKRDEEDVQMRLKQGFGFVMAQRRGTTGRPYFSRGGVPERVKDMKHLRYLLEVYLPKHRAAMWCMKLK